MSKNNLVILHGAGRLSEIIYNVVKDDYEKFYLYVDADYLKYLQSYTKIPVISSLPDGVSADYISTIGYKSMEKRKSAYIFMSSKDGLSSVNIVHPAAYISPAAKIGVGNIFFPGVIVEDGVCIGDNYVFWSNACICHDAIIGNHGFFAASVTIGGYCIIGESCFLGFGSIVNEQLELADCTFSASGSVIVKSQLIVGARLCGVPAKVM